MLIPTPPTRPPPPQKKKTNKKKQNIKMVNPREQAENAEVLTLKRQASAGQTLEHCYRSLVLLSRKNWQSIPQSPALETDPLPLIHRGVMQRLTDYRETSWLVVVLSSNVVK